MASKDQFKPEVPPVAEAPRKGRFSPAALIQTLLAGLLGLPRLLSPKKIFQWAKSDILMAAVALGSLIAMAMPGVIYWAHRHAKYREIAAIPEKIEEIYHLLGSGELDATKALAKQLLHRKGVPEKDAGVAPFALGAVALIEAEKAKGKKREKLQLLANKYLEEANEKGFPEAHRAEGLFFYGQSLYEIKQFAKAEAALKESLKADPKHPAEIFLLLADVYRNETPPKLAEAMEQVVNYLNLPDLDQADREKGLLRKARLSLRMDKLDECRAVLKEIPEDSPEHPEATVIGGEALMREAQIARGKGPDVPEENLAQSREKYKEAIDVFRQAEEAAEMGSEAMLQAMYFIGICFMETGDFRAAFDQFTRLHKRYPDSTEGVAACLQQAELSYRAGRDMEMLSEYRRAVGGIEPSVPFHNPWISSELLKARLSDSYQHFLGQSRYEVCLQMAGLLKRLLPPEQLKLLLADLYNKWGQSLSSGADQAPRSRREPMRRLARDKLRRAGAYYIELAKMYLDTKQYTDYLWSAATVYLQGHDYRRAAGLFRDYLKNEVSRRHPQALDYLGESLLSMGDYKAALETLKECIELFPRDVAACHARILAAQAARELGDYAEAERILLANLNGDYLTPASKEWRESLFLLGDLYHLAGRYADAARRLNEIVQRYPDLPETLLSRYLLADSCRHLGMAMQDDLKKDISGSSLATQSKQIAENYARALEQYRFIVEKLGGNHDAAEMSDVEKAVLRNSYFSIGYVLFAAGDYQASVKALFAAVNRYQNRPEMFDAYVQIASAYRLLGKPDEAENALTQAKLLLARMKPETSFRETSIYSRDEWNNRLDRMLAGGS